MEEEMHLTNASMKRNTFQRLTEPKDENMERSLSIKCDENKVEINNNVHIEDSCGCGLCRPTYLKCFATIRKFVLSLAILSVFQGTLAVGYIGSVVTTIQRRYDLPTYLVGFIVSVYDIGCLSAVLFTSYLGGRPTANKPKWITFSSYLMAIGAAVYTIPHFLGPIYKPPYIVDSGMQIIDSCFTSGDIVLNNITCEDQEIQHHGTVAVFILAEFLIGIGSTSVLTLGTIYIDDFAKRSEGSLFISILYCMGAVGPALGYVFGSLFLKIYVDIGRVDMAGIKVSPSDEQWVGAWWLGFLVCSICIFCTASPVIMYPKSMTNPQDELDDETSKEEPEGRVQMSFHSSSLKELPRAFRRLVSNPIYFFVCMTACSEFSIISGFVKFVPKFIESQFSIPAQTANLLTASLIPSAAIGTVFGAYMIRRLKMGLTGMTKFCFLVILLGFIILALSFLLGGCDSIVLAGLTTPYQYRQSSDSTENLSDLDLLDSCNSECDCSLSEFQPVCASSIGVTYFSPCHAGCFRFGSGDNSDVITSNVTTCNCITKYLKDRGTSGHGYPIPGKCSNECNLLIPFMCVLISLVIVISSGQIPMVMTTLRSVGKDDRPFALGVQFLLVRLFAYIPSPTYFGAVIDRACILWEDNCGTKGSCLEYDNHLFFLVYLGLCTSLKIVSIILAFIVWRLACRLEANGSVPYTQGLASQGEDEVIYEFKTMDSKL